MKRLLTVACLMLTGLGGMEVASHGVALAATGGNSAAAAACQQNGYLSLIGTNGTADTTFTNTGQCVSYAALGGMLVWTTAAAPCLNGGWQTLAPAMTPSQAFTSEAACVQYVGQGGTPVPVFTCAFTAGSTGCMSMNGLSMPYLSDSSLGTLALTGNFTFLASCDFCSGAGSGSGTYSVTGGTFNGGTSGTFTITGTAYAQFFNASFAPVPCANSTNGTVYASATLTDSVTHQTMSVEVPLSFSSGRSPSAAGVVNPTNNSPYYFALSVPSSEMSINC